ncbi:MAG: aspartate/glutamate racemase family protein [Leucobacter sp.]|nr:aspartate/glutamate racemase family protein [Leucobacter sp.]
MDDAPAEAALHEPVGIFDGGIGSFDMVRRIRAAFPQQDIIYLADRASFPYGALTEAQLLDSVTRATAGLVRLGAASVILASNAPSVTVLDALRPLAAVPVFGVTPPVRAALDAVGPEDEIAVAGAQVMVNSAALTRYIAASAGVDADRVHSVRADELIGLVESGAFLTPAATATPIRAFVEALRAAHPRVTAVTLSSTHLPWLADELRRAAPELLFCDPADDVVAAFTPHATTGSGQLRCIATASAQHPLSEFQSIIDGLQLGFAPSLVEW